MSQDPRETFSRSAERYLESTDHQTGPDLELIKEIAKRSMPGVTLDVATGAGHALRAAAPFSAQCLAQDLTLEMLRVTRKHLASVGIKHVSCFQSMADSLPIRDGSVDLALCRIACHHFPSIPGFLREVHRVMDPGGTLIIIDSLAPDNGEAHEFINRVERIRDPSHIGSLSVMEWRKQLKGAGLRVEDEREFQRRHPFTEWVDRVGLEGAGRWALEKEFREAPEKLKRQFRIQLDDNGLVLSYTDEKGIFVAGKQ